MVPPLHRRCEIRALNGNISLGVHRSPFDYRKVKMNREEIVVEMRSGEITLAADQFLSCFLLGGWADYRPVICHSPGPDRRQIRLSGLN